MDAMRIGLILFSDILLLVVLTRIDYKNMRSSKNLSRYFMAVGLMCIITTLLI